MNVKLVRKQWKSTTQYAKVKNKNDSSLKNQIWNQTKKYVNN